MKPTDKQKRWLWERCEWIYDEKSEGWTSPEGRYHYNQPPTDMNNLTKHAVSFLLEKHTIIETYSFKQENDLYYSETTIWDRDERQLKGKLISKAFIQDFNLEKATALALFWAIFKAFEGKE